MGSNGPVPRSVLLLGSALAAVAGVVYLAIGTGMVPEDFRSPPPPVMLVAGIAYLVGGVVIPWAERRLLLFGAAANAVVLLLFLASVARDNATVDALSLSGKAAQLALGAVLIWTVWRTSNGQGESETAHG